MKSLLCVLGMLCSSLAVARTPTTCTVAHPELAEQFQSTARSKMMSRRMAKKACKKAAKAAGLKKRDCELISCVKT